MARENGKPASSNGSNTLGPDAAGQATSPAETIDLRFCLQALVQARHRILGMALLAALLFAGLSLILPKVYLARTVLLPPELHEASNWQHFLDDSPVLALAMPKHQNSANLFLDILSSRAVGERVLNWPLADSTATTLLDLWQLRSMEKALKRLGRRTTFSSTPEGMITIEVEMEAPHLAATIANTYVRALDAVNREKAFSQARATRQYIETQQQITREKLQLAADSLAAFQAVHRAVSLDDQARSIFEQAGALKGEIYAKEIELRLLRQQMLPANPLLQSAERELAGLNQQYSKLSGGGGESADPLPAVAALPRIAEEFAALYREVRAQETAWEYLTQQLHRARIQEARDTPTIQQLDIAVPPESPMWPRPVLMTGLGGLLGFLLTGIGAVAAAVLRIYSLNAAEMERWREVTAPLLQDWQALRRRLHRTVR